MKKVSKVMILLMLIVSCVGMSITAAYGEDGENVGVSTSMPNRPADSNVQAYGINPPGKEDTYSINTSHSISGSASRSPLYTNKCFYGVNKIYLSLQNEQDDELNFKLCRYEWYGYSMPKKDYVPVNCSYGKLFSGLDVEKYYFFKFEAPSDFSGKVTGYK